MSRTRLLSFAALVVLSCAGLSCKKSAPVAPTEFDSPQRAMTGDASLENLVADAIALELMTDEELEELREESQQVGRTTALSKYIALTTGRGDLQTSINTLLDRAWVNLADEVLIADVLDLTMGQLKWSTCAEITTRLLERRMEPAVFLLRGLCLRRSGDAALAAENLEAAFAKDPLPREVANTIRELVDERAGGNQLLPSDEERYKILREGLGRKGPLHRLFVQHLTERSDPGWTTGTLDWFGIWPEDQTRVILSRTRSYRHCHALAQYESKKPLTGNATIVFYIDGLGRVTNQQIAESDWGGHEQGEWLNACLLDQISKLRFPLPKYGRPMPARHKVSYVGE
jgi:hypothetical protein